MNAVAITGNVKTEERLYQTIAGVLGVSPDQLSDASSPKTIPAWDSLNHLNLVMALESEFGISLTPEAALGMHNVGAMRAILQDRGVEFEMPTAFLDCPTERLAEVRAFFARAYRPTYRLATDDALLRWQYGPTPASPQKPTHLKLGLLDGAIAGCLGYIPVEVSLNGRVVTGTWVANWMVEPDKRQLGLGPFLMREVTKEFEALLDLGANEDARGLLSRMGWTDMGNLHRYVCVLDQTAAAQLTETGQLDWPAKTVAEGNRAAVRFVDCFDQEATELWDRTWGAKGSAAGGTRRSAEFLNWRYASHPVFKYRLFEERREGRLTGLAVYHIEQVRERTERVGRLVELITDGTEGGLLPAVLDDARSQGACMLDFFCASRRLEGLLTRHGFRPGDQEPANRIPVLFQPLDRRRAGIRFMFHLGKLPEANAISDWYVTKSDGDQDRPN